MKHKLLGYAFSLFVAVMAYSGLSAPTVNAAPVPTYEVRDSDAITATGGAIDVVSGKTNYTYEMGVPAAGNLTTITITNATAACGSGGQFSVDLDIIRAGTPEDESWAIRKVTNMRCDLGSATSSDVFDESSWWTPGSDGMMHIADIKAPDPSDPPPSMPKLANPPFRFWSAKSAEGEYIYACGGIFSQFETQTTTFGDTCLEFSNTRDEAETNLVWNTVATVANKQTSGCSAPTKATFTFDIKADQPTTMIEEENDSGITQYGLPVTVYVSDTNVIGGEDGKPGCSFLQLNEMAGGGSLATTVWGVNDIDSILGMPVEGVGESNKSLCQVTGGLSWILCPMMNTMADVNEKSYELIEHFLRIPPMMSDGSNNGAYEVWKMIRNIANVAFALVFLVIIYSQLTSAGISNYGVKKMLPKLLAGIILVNTSFWIVALSVDLSNVIGSSVYEIMDNMAHEAAPADNEVPGWVEVTGGVLGNTLAVGAGTTVAVMVGVSVLLPMLIGAAFMIVGLVFVLTFRHAIVFILAVISPLAFVAYLLPNTEGLFKSWFKMLRVLLYIFPAIAFIMGASNVAAMIMFAASQGPDGKGGEGIAGFVMMLIAVAMPAMAIFAALMLAKTMGSVASKLGLSNPFSGMINAAKSRGEAAGKNADGALSRSRIGNRIGGVGNSRRQRRDYKQQMRDDAQGNRDKIAVLRSKRGKNLAQQQGIMQQGMESSTQQTGDEVAQRIKDNAADAVVAGGTMEGGADRAVDHAQARIDKRQEEVVENARSRMGSQHVDDLFKTLKDTSKTDEERAAAARQITKTGGDQHVQEMVDYMAKARAGGDTGMKTVQMLTADAAKGRKSAAWGNTDYSNLARGELTTSYNDSMMQRLKDGKIGADELLSMGNDDRIRIAQLAKDNPTEMAKVMPGLQDAIKEIYTNENTKDRVTPEMVQAFTDIQTGAGPTQLTNKDGTKRDALQHLKFDRK